jgi:hypothetical protein
LFRNHDSREADGELVNASNADSALTLILTWPAALVWATARDPLAAIVTAVMMNFDTDDIVGIFLALIGVFPLKYIYLANDCRPYFHYTHLR